MKNLVKKVVLVLAVTVSVALLNSCTELDENNEDIIAIDKEEIKDTDI